MGKERTRLVLFVFAAIYLALAAYMFIQNFKGFDKTNIILTIITSVAILTIYVISIYSYLRDYNKFIKKDAKNLKENVQPPTKPDVAENVNIAEEEKIDNEPYQHINLQSAVEEAISRYRELVSDDEIQKRDIINIFRETERRLGHEIDSLGRRANINLILGSIVALAGIGTLALFISDFVNSSYDSELSMIIINWLARLSLVIIVEFFSFFFLRLYREELLSIKYYQDELTSVESRKIGLMFAVINNCKEDISKAVELLLRIDRNFIIGNNQTTVELEKLKMEKELHQGISNRLFEIIKSIIPNIQMEKE